MQVSQGHPNHNIIYAAYVEMSISVENNVTTYLSRVRLHHPICRSEKECGRHPKETTNRASQQMPGLSKVYLEWPLHMYSHVMGCL